MSFQLTQRIIKLLCGPLSYERGEAYYANKQVTFITYDNEAQFYEASVDGNHLYSIALEIDRNGDVDATCSCTAFYTNNQYCKHIAAVLLSIHHTEQNGSTPVRSYSFDLHTEERFGRADGHLEPRTARSSKNQEALTSHMLALFDDKPKRTSGVRKLFDKRTVLAVEITLKPVPYGYHKHMFSVEMKVGPKRLYIVQQIREFLDRIERREAFVFSKHFTYDPQLHCFEEKQDAVLQQLIQIVNNENMYRDTMPSQSYSSNTANDARQLPIPPYAWEAILPLFVQAPSMQLKHRDHLYEGIALSDEALPLSFAFDEARSEGYQLNIQGLDGLTVMDSYGIILLEGRMIQLPLEECKRLSELKQLLAASSKHQIQIQQAQIEPFMDKVIPGLMKLGSIQIAKSVSDRIVHAPLKAKLYLDRVRDRLLAGLDFHYGDIVVNPLEGLSDKRGSDRILMRDGDRERQILTLMEQSSFAQTEAGYFMDDEDGEYEFLYHIIPQLEKLLDVYATSAVKVRIHTVATPPQISVNVDERTEWLEFKFNMDGIPDSEIRHILQALEEKRSYYRMPSGALLPLETAEYQEIIRFMNEVGLHKLDLRGSQYRLPAVRGLHLIDVDVTGRSVKLGKSLRKLLDNMRNPENLDFPVPSSLTSVLRDYQVYGYQWFKTLAHYRFGGILADDMGLGKTLQSLSFIVSVLPEIREREQPAIIVCPASLVYNWLNELKKFAPEVRAVIIDGTRHERSKLLSQMTNCDVIITSYPLLRRDIDLYLAHSFHTLIMDEAQMFKNHTTLTARSVKGIQAEYRFALTGTPVENSLEELWSIFGAVFPELFPNRQAFNEMDRTTVAKRIRPFLLRRVKSDVLQELPEKIETLQASELLPEQKKLYAAYLARLKHDTLKHLNEGGFQKNRIRILAGLTRLRQLCCHPALFVEGYNGSSAKFEQLLEIIEECRSAGKRMLIFSQFTEMLSLIRRELGLQGISHFYLDGHTKSSDRVEFCNRFNDGERDLFLISLKAGGTGLNLTGADTVILYDLWWNPAVEQQAADRAHRIGQKNVVQVIRLVAQGTVEDKMYELQQKKKNLIDEVIQPGQEALSSLTEEELRDLLML